VSTPIADARFLRGVFAGLVFATGMCATGVIYALLAVPPPQAGMIISYLSSPSVNAQFLRRVFGFFVLTTAIAGVAVSYALLAVTFTPTTSTLALLLPG
jgi:hypothetical protein